MMKITHVMVLAVASLAILFAVHLDRSARHDTGRETMWIVGEIHSISQREDGLHVTGENLYLWEPIDPAGEGDAE